MKAIVLHEYGAPSKLKYEDVPDPKPGRDEVLVRVQAVSVNPIDWKLRSGVMQSMFPLTFPAILGYDLAGTVRELGEGAQGFAIGDRVFGVAANTYAELCAVKTSDLAKIPDGLEMTTAAAVPLVAITGDQLMRQATGAQPGQTIVLTGAVGSVGRCALFAALEIGAKVIAGVRKNQMNEARALGATEVIDLGDDASIARLGTVDAVADTVGGEIAAKLLAKVKPGGNFGSVLGPPKDAALHPTVNIRAFSAQHDAQTVAHYGEAVRDGRLKLPIESVTPLQEVADAHTTGEKGGAGKLILVP